HRAARFGQRRPARSLALEQGDAESRLQVGDAIADDRDGPAQLARGAVETAFVDHGEEDADSVDVRPFHSLGAANHGWLDAHHPFSFADYYDPQRVQWGASRVWNDDTIAAQSGFPPHPHSDMEIVTYVRKGAISHRDSSGNAGRTVAGDVQVMSAGTGIQHAEYNSEDEETTSFQIWIMPDRRGHAPSWGTRPFPRDSRTGRFDVSASGVAG
ncbi:hypothetical protein OY671_008502, partial [Metschnikowia pulcherrima]